MTSDWGMIIFFLLGVILVVMGIVTRLRAKRTESWPIASGTILSSSVSRRSQYDSDSNHTSTTYKPSIKYQYSVMGQLLNGSRVAMGSDTYNKKKANQIVERYPANSPVNVHYNPEKVGESVLETAANGSITNIILGVVFVVIGLFISFFA
jgi:hypothetical protein